MRNRGTVFRLTGILLLIAVWVLLFVIFKPWQTSEPAETAEPEQPSSLEIWFLDVGQGDAALLACDGETMLIDGGDRTNSSFLYSFLRNREIHTLKYVVASHPDSDHIGGLPGALHYASAENALCTVSEDDSDRFADFTASLNGIPVTVPKAGDTFSLGSAEVTVLYPIPGMDYNTNTSVVLRVDYGSTSFLFTGDCPSVDELTMCAADLLSPCTVLKVAHHGSASSTTLEFLQEVRPEVAVISVGKDNSYRHPSSQVLQKLAQCGAAVLRTDYCGTIHCVSDGAQVVFDYEKNGIPDVTAAAPEPSETDAVPAETGISETSAGYDYVLNIKSMRFHRPDCGAVRDMKEHNKVFFTGTREELIEQGYSPCGSCKP